MTARGLAVLLLVAGLTGSPVPIARSLDKGMRAPSSAVPGSDGQRPVHQDLSILSNAETQGDGLRAVAIFGDGGVRTEDNRADMAHAVEVLRRHNVSVDTFYFGEHDFGWSEVVDAATGANFLLYMGHGVYWSGSCTHPELVGGFHLGKSFVHPDDIRTGLSGRMASDAAVILSHACFSAGTSACDAEVPNWPTAPEAARRVGTYAAPFVDIGVQAYFANNYSGSTAAIIETLLTGDGVTAGDVFQSIFPYDPARFQQLEYPDASEYALWLSGETGHWHHAFVGVPDYVFPVEQIARLGPLPESLTFTYFLSDTVFLPSAHTLVPENVGSTEPLKWEVTSDGDWFIVEPTAGDSCASSTCVGEGFSITPLEPHKDPQVDRSGVITLTVTEPEGTEDGVQAIDLHLRIAPGSPTWIHLPLLLKH